MFARIELFLNENRYLRCHAERPDPGEFGAILFGGNDFHYLMRMEIKPLGLTVEEPRSTRAHCAPLFLLLFGNTILFLANPWSGKGRSFCHYFHAKKKGKNEFST